MGVTGLWRQGIAEAADLFFPVDCAGCGDPGLVLCAGCRSTLTRTPWARQVGSGGTRLDVVAAGEFSGVVARVIRALKEDGRTGLARPLADGLRLALAQAAAGCEDAVTVVAIPSSWRARRRRGFAVNELLLRRAGIASTRALTVNGSVRDQRALDRLERRANMSEAFRSRPLPGQRVLLVDDVVTTGATLLAAAAAVRAAGATVVGAAVLAATPRRFPNSG